MAIAPIMQAASAASRKLLLRWFLPMGSNGIVTSGNDATAAGHCQLGGACRPVAAFAA